MDATHSPGPPERPAAADDATTIASGLPSTALRAGAAADARAVGWSERKAAGAVRAALFGEAPKPLVPRYRLDRVLGRGAMGEVWQAHDPRLDRDVAVKLILPRLEGDADAARRVAREARALARLTHPNVVAVYDVGSYDGPHGRGTFIVMELVLGEPLDAWLARGRRSMSEILDVFCQAGEGLAAAHAVGIVHRDFKPSNVLVGADGRARVGDFGLARAFGQPDDGAPTVGLSSTPVGEMSDTLAGTLTATGTVMGTPLYMAPEQHDGRATDARADQYAFCTSLFEAVFRRRPFSGGIAELAVAKARGPRLTASEERDAPLRIQDAILRGLAPRAEDRHVSMEALLGELRGGRARGNRRTVAAVVVGVALVGVAVAVADADERCPPLAELDDTTGRAQLERALAAELDGPQVAALLERFAAMESAIAAEHSATCEVDPPLASGRAACVRAAARHYAAAVDVLVEYDVTAQQAHGVLDAAPDVRACADAGDQPVTNQARAEAEERRLAEASTLQSVGRYDQALAVALEVRDSLDAPEARLGREATWVRSKLEVATQLRALQRQSESLGEYEAAYLGALEIGLDDLAFKAAQHLAMQHASLGAYPLAERWVAHAEAAHAALPPEQARPWELDFMRSVIANYHWDYATVTRLLPKVIATCEQHECGETLVSARRNLARTYSLVHDFDAARRAWSEEQARSIAKYGPDAPYALEAAIFEAAATATITPEEGRRRLEALVDRLAAMDPPAEARLRGMAGVELAQVLAEQEDVAGALAVAKATADVVANAPGLGELHAVALSRAASYAGALGDHAAAGAFMDEAVEADEAPIARAQALLNRTSYRARQGRRTEALADAETARDLMREHFPSSLGRVATAEFNVLVALLMLVRCSELLGQSEVALEAWEAVATDAEAPVKLRDIHTMRGICLERVGEAVAAANEYRAALLLGGPAWPDRGKIERNVASIEAGAPTTPTRPALGPTKPADAKRDDDAQPRP